MRGITEERLEEIFEGLLPFTGMTKNCLKDFMEELTPWHPIADAPKDRQLLLAIPTNTKVIGTFDSQINKFRDQDWYVIEQPTHYQELPGDPV